MQATAAKWGFSYSAGPFQRTRAYDPITSMRSTILSFFGENPPNSPTKRGTLLFYSFMPVTPETGARLIADQLSRMPL
jgi:hypothetical protein